MIKKYMSLKIRVTPEQREGFLKVAQEIDETPSRLLRKLIRESINGKIDLLTDERLLLKILLRQLFGIRNNLRQINTAMNNNKTLRTIDESILNEHIEFVSSFHKEILTTMFKTNRRWVKGISKNILLTS